MLILAAAMLVSGAIVWGVGQIAAALAGRRDEAARAAALRIAGTFAPAIAAAADDPRAVIVWEGLARTTRALAPEAFALLDSAAGARFPYSPAQIQAAHDRWTADWLAWERAHDVEYKLKAARLEEETGASEATPVARARLEAVEQEKLARYQQRYAEYVGVARTLQALIS